MSSTERGQSPNNPILNAAALARVACYGKTSAVEAGVVVVEQGDPVDRFLIVIDGEIAVTQNIRGGVESVTTHAAGQFFGDVHSLSGRPCLAGGRMLTDGHIVTLDRASL